MRRILLRAALFLVPASSLFALLPLIASHRLGLGSGGYGLLVAALGLGAIAGALVRLVHDLRLPQRLRLERAGSRMAS